MSTKKETTAKKAASLQELDAETLAKNGFTIDGTILTSCKPPKKVKEMILPEGITEIKKGAFLEAKIDKLVLPSTISSIPDECFSGWKAVHEIDISDGVTEIGVKAFNGCEKLTTLWFGASLKSFKKDIIGECKKLDDIHISASNKKLASFSGTVFDKKLTKPSYVPYHKSDLILPPTLMKFTTNCIIGKIKTLTFDLRGSSAAELKNNLEKGAQNFVIRSINTLRFITDTKEHELDLSGYKYAISYPVFADIYPDKNVVKNLVGEVIQMILSNSADYHAIEVLHKSGFGQRCSYWYRASLYFSISEIIADLFDRDVTQLYAAAVEVWCNTVEDNDDEETDVDSLSSTLEQHPEVLYATFGCEKAVRQCIQLYANAGDMLVGKVTPEQIERAIKISIEENASKTTSALRKLN